MQNILLAILPCKSGLGGFPFDIPNNGFWFEVLGARNPSWYQPAGTHWVFFFFTVTREGEEASLPFSNNKLCSRPPQYTPSPFHLGLLTLKMVSKSRVTWPTTVPILVFLGLCSRLRPNVRHRQTDVRQHHRLMPPPRGGGHNNNGIYTAPYSRNFRDSGGRSVQCSVKPSVLCWLVPCSI